MSDRVMSPTAAAAHARRTIRTRYKALRLGKRVDPPKVLADRLITYAEATSLAFPVEPSNAYREHVEAAFSTRFLALSATNPVAVRRGQA